MKEVKRIKFTSFPAGIQFFEHVNQFKRVTDEIKKIHDTKMQQIQHNIRSLGDNISSLGDNISSLEEGLSYYTLEKELILGMMKDLFDNHTEEVKQEEVEKEKDKIPF